MSPGSKPDEAGPARIGGAGQGFELHAVTAAGHRMRCWSRGQGEPPLVHVHGGTGPTLTASHDRLSAGRRVVLVEMPGFGGTPDDPSIASRHDMAARLWALVDAAGIGDTALMGSSLGAGTALAMALADPERVTALVLEAPSVIRPGHLVVERVPPEEMARRAFADPARMLALMPQIDPANRTGGPNPMMRRLIGPSRDLELESRMKTLAVPTLVVYGRQDGLVPAQLGGWYRALLPRSAFAMVLGAAHAVQEEQPAAFAQVVDDFLTDPEVLVGLGADVAVVEGRDGADAPA